MKKRAQIQHFFYHQPYLGWLVMFFVSILIIFSIFQFYKVFNNEQSTAVSFQKQFDNKLIQSAKTINAIIDNNDNAAPLINNDTLNYYLYFENDSIIAWNTNLFNSNVILKSFNDSNYLQEIDNYYIYAKIYNIDSLNSKKIIHIIPFAAINKLDKNAHLITPEYAKNFDIIVEFDKDAFSSAKIYNLKIDKGKNMPYQIKDIKIKNVTFFIDCFFMISILSLLIWIFNICLYLKRKYNNFLIIACLYLFNEGIIYFFKHAKLIPITLLEGNFFNPLLFSSVNGFNNFGQIIVETVLNLMLLLFTLTCFTKKNYFIKNTNNKVIKNIIKHFIAFGIIAFGFYNIEKFIYPLVFDSRISFSADNIEHITIYTYWAVFVLVFTFVNFILGINIIHKIFKINAASYKKDTVFIMLYSLIIVIYYIDKIHFSILLTTFLSILLSLILFKKIGTPFSYLNGGLTKNLKSLGFIWIIFAGMIPAISLIVLTKIKEEQIRTAFAEKQARTKDVVLEYSAEIIGEDLKNDTLIANAILNNRTNHLTEYLNNKYFFPLFDNPNLSILIINNKGNIIESKNVNIAIQFPTTLKDKSFDFTYNDAITNPTSYIFYYAIKNNDSIIGYIASYLNSINNTSKAGYLSEFDKNTFDEQFIRKYAIGYYQNGILMQQNGELPIPAQLDTTQTNAINIIDNIRYSDLIFPTNKAQETIVVRYERNIILNFVSYFSYTMISLLIAWFIINFIWNFLLFPSRYFFQNRKIHFTIKNKINITIWFTVFISFAIIGTFTYFIFREKNKSIQYYNLLEQINITKHILNTNKINNLSAGDISNYLNNVQNDLKIASEVFDERGILIANSENIHNNKLTGKNLLDFNVLRDIQHYNRNTIIIDEKVNNNTLKIAYCKLNLMNNEILKITYNNSNSSSYIDTNDIYLALINIYILIFILSTLIASLISNNITKSFNLLIKKFRNVSLKHNENIEWPYDDEIGILVKEYNLMIKKVENLASKLSQTERENVWREMAQQVAHEIKNPLTPMKLHVQYLDNAIKNKQTNVEELTQKVCGIISTQIDQLNHIATEFSNFAKMPKANPELVNVNEIIKLIIVLFEKEDNITIKHNDLTKTIYTYMDKSFLIRALTNIIKNGIQAIPKDKHGIIDIKTAANQKQIIISIQDNGSGIPKHLMEKLFTPNFTTKSSGSGIGLSMVKNIIENAGGNIRFRTKENEGTIFYITLPIKIINTNRELL